MYDACINILHIQYRPVENTDTICSTVTQPVYVNITNALIKEYSYH